MECSSVSGRVDIVSTGEGGGSPLAPSRERIGLPDELLSEIFKNLTAYEKRSMFRVSKELGELAITDPPDLLKALENFHKDLARHLSDPLIGEQWTKEVIAEGREVEQFLGSRLTREKQGEGVSIRLMGGKRNLSKEEADIYKELIQMSGELICELLERFPAHGKVIRKIIDCQSALLRLPSPEKFQEWAREGKFELTKMLFDFMSEEEQEEFAYTFAKVLLEEGDIETAHLVAKSIPAPYLYKRRKALWEVYRAYLLCGDLESAFEIAKDDFKDPHPAIDTGSIFVAGKFVKVADIIQFTDILEEFAVREQWDRVKEGIELLEADRDKATSINYGALSEIAQSKWRKKENFLRAIEFTKKDPKIFHYVTCYAITRVIKEFVLRWEDYKLAREMIERDIDTPAAKEIALQEIEIASLVREGKIKEAEEIVATTGAWYRKNRCLSMIALVFAHQGNKEEAMRYRSQIKDNEPLREDIDRVLLERR